MAEVIKSGGSVGGRSASAQSGGYNQGLQFAASHKSGNGGSGGDVRGGNANASSGYNQGAQFAAQAGGDKPGTQRDLRGGAKGTGAYVQGNQFGASKK